jgi:hypothetical protein
MSPSSFLTTVAPYLAIYAAGLSTVNGVITLTNFFRDRRVVKISFESETQVDDDGYPGQTHTVVTVANAGRRPVTIIDVHAVCLFPRGEHKLDSKPELPEVELKEHQRLVAWADDEQLDLADVEAFIAHDALGHPYRKNVASWYKRLPSHLRRNCAKIKRAYKRHHTDKMVKELMKKQ